MDCQTSEDSETLEDGRLIDKLYKGIISILILVKALGDDSTEIVEYLHQSENICDLLLNRKDIISSDLPSSKYDEINYLLIKIRYASVPTLLLFCLSNTKSLINIEALLSATLHVLLSKTKTIDIAQYLIETDPTEYLNKEKLSEYEYQSLIEHHTVLKKMMLG